MSTSVTMPALGESVTEGTVTRWLKQEGDQVQADEPLLEVSTDKVDTEIPSHASGVLSKIVVGEDETVAVGAELAVIGGGGGGGADAGAPQQQAAPQQEQASPQQQEQPAQQPGSSLISAPAPQQQAPAQQEQAPRQQPAQQPAPV
jgi:pyruvate dehydrogenase E2 component (dihydrolipoamide acetyltransferase)